MEKEKKPTKKINKAIEEIEVKINEQVGSIEIKEDEILANIKKMKHQTTSYTQATRKGILANESFGQIRKVENIEKQDK